MLSRLSSPRLSLLAEQGRPRGEGWLGLVIRTDREGTEEDVFTFSFMIGSQHCSQMFLMVCEGMSP